MNHNQLYQQTQETSVVWFGLVIILILMGGGWYGWTVISVDWGSPSNQQSISSVEQRTLYLLKRGQNDFLLLNGWLYKKETDNRAENRKILAKKGGGTLRQAYFRFTSRSS